MADSPGYKVGMSPGYWFIILQRTSSSTVDMLGVCDARNNHSKSPKKNRERSTLWHPNFLRPVERGIPIAVVKMATNKLKEPVERLRTADAGIQSPFYLREKIIEDAREEGGGRAVRGDGFPERF